MPSTIDTICLDGTVFWILSTVVLERIRTMGEVIMQRLCKFAFADIISFIYKEDYI